MYNVCVPVEDCEDMLCTCGGSISCMKNHLYGKNQPVQRGIVIRNAIQATMPRIKLREYRSSVHKPPQKCTQLNGRMHVDVV